MEKWEVEAALMFKGKGKGSQVSVSTGKVIRSNPLTISLGDEIILDAEDLVVSNRIALMVLQPNDQLILISNSSGQIYYAIDKVGR